MTANGTNGLNGGKQWWVLTTLVTLLLSICGATVSAFNGRLRDMEYRERGHVERLTALEAHLDALKGDLQRIERKLDQLIERKP
jgi:hypothetical protein